MRLIRDSPTGQRRERIQSQEAPKSGEAEKNWCMYQYLEQYITSDKEEGEIISQQNDRKNYERNHAMQWRYMVDHTLSQSFIDDTSF